ncbi:MAG: alpha/beta fold hydrolase [Cyanobacteria bacterium]|nr:alpha/beta fold hydrolase [Cyanobacteriota bacterium]
MNQQTGIFLIHGLMGSPREYAPLETILHLEGYQTQTVTLPGHGYAPEKPFHQVSANEILAHCLSEYTAFAEKHDDVIMIGHSLGGLCSLLTSAENPPKLSGVVALSTPFEHAYWVNQTKGLFNIPFKDFLSSLPYIKDSLTGFERPHLPVWKFPQMVKQGEIIFQAIQERISKIDVPVLLAHSIYDLSVPYSEMNKLVQALQNAPIIEHHTLDNSGHQIFPVSQDREKVIQLILQFLNKHGLTKPKRFQTLLHAGS